MRTECVIIDINGPPPSGGPAEDQEQCRVSIEAVAPDLAIHLDRLLVGAASCLGAHADVQHPGDLVLTVFPGLMVGRRSDDGLPRLDYSKPLRRSAWYGRYRKSEAGPCKRHACPSRFASMTSPCLCDLAAERRHSAKGYPAEVAALIASHDAQRRAPQHEEVLRVTGEALAARRARRSSGSADVINLATRRRPDRGA
jgi:hypothetical protein